MIRTPGYAVQRLRQTFGFANGPRVLADLASTKTPWPRKELVFRMRDGSSITCPNVPGARLAVYEHFVEDTYRLDELTAGLRPDFVVLDVGAQVGAFAVALARHSSAAHVHAFEASPETARWAGRNVDANDLGDRITVHSVALADHVGTLAFADSGEGSVHNGLTNPDGSARTIEVPCTTFDGAVAAAGGRVDVLKMDAEGAEYDTILSSPRESWADVQRVVMEYHPVSGHSWDELVDFFASVGLLVTRDKPGDRPGLGLAWLARKA